MDKKEAGRLGGLATVKKYGREYMSTIGKRGYQVTASKYTVLPARVKNWVMVRKDTKEVVSIW